MARERKAPDIGPREFTEVLEDLAHGAVVERLTDRLGEIVHAVKETGSPGMLTLKIKVKRTGEHAAISADISCRKPELGMPETSFFFGRGGGLTREDPRQLELRDLRAAPAKPRVVGAAFDEAPGDAPPHIYGDDDEGA